MHLFRMKSTKETNTRPARRTIDVYMRVISENKASNVTGTYMRYANMVWSSSGLALNGRHPQLRSMQLAKPLSIVQHNGFTKVRVH